MIIIFIILSTLDLLLSLYVFRKTSIEAELNPIAVIVYNNGGEIGLSLFKAIATAFVAIAYKVTKVKFIIWFGCVINLIAVVLGIVSYVAIQ
jgi:hypothetical protein